MIPLYFWSMACQPAAEQSVNAPPADSAAHGDSSVSDYDSSSKDTDSVSKEEGSEQLPDAADPLWNLVTWPTLSLSLEDADWEETLWNLVPEDPCAEREQLFGQLTFSSPLLSPETLDSVGVRYRGNSSLTLLGEGERPGFKISFNAGKADRRYRGVQKLNLLGTEGDASGMRELLSYHLLRSLGLLTPRYGYAWLQINGSLQGLYPLVEEVDEAPFLDYHLREDDGALFKVNGYCGGSGDFQWLGTDPAAYTAYEPRAKTDAAAISEHLIPLIECANTVEDSDFQGCIEGLLVVDDWLRYIAADVALPDIDGFIGSGQNFMIYHSEEGQWQIWPWDKDLALSVTDLGVDSLYEVHPSWNPDFLSVLGSRLVRVYRERYCSEMLEVTERLMLLTDTLSEWTELLQEGIEADPAQDAEYWGWMVEDIREVLRARPAELDTLARSCEAD